MEKNKIITNILASMSPDTFTFDEGDLIIAKSSNRPFRVVMIKEATHPIFLLKKLMIKITTNAQKKSVGRIIVDSITKADCSFVSQHSSKPSVVLNLR